LERYLGSSGLADAAMARSSANFAAAVGEGFAPSAMAWISSANFFLITGVTGSFALIDPRSVSNCNTACDFGGACGAGVPGAVAGVGCDWVGGATPWRTLFWLLSSLARSRTMVSGPAITFPMARTFAAASTKANFIQSACSDG